MKALLSMVAVVTLILVGEGPAHGQTKTKCRRQCGKATTKSYDLAVSSVSGDQIRGPATVRADNLNVLRYEYKFNLAIAFSAAPDLWAKLQSAAAPAPSPAPEKPTTGSAQRPPPPRHVSNKSQQSIIDQAEALIRDAGVAMAAADDAIAAAAGRADVRDCLGIPQDVDTSKETNVQADCLADLVTRSVTAVAQVKAGGQALVALLQAKWNKPDLLVSFINGELSATSTFTKAITAEWPNPNTTATLKRIAQAWKTELASRASKFSDSLPSISGSLVSAKRPLTDIQQTLIIKAKAASGDDQKALTDEASNVQRAVESLDDKVKQLSKTTTLLNWATGENQRVLGVIPDLELSSSKYSDFQTAQGALQGWKTRMTELSNSWNTYVTAKTQGKSEEENPSPFSLSKCASSGLRFRFLANEDHRHHFDPGRFDARYHRSRTGDRIVCHR